MTLRRLWRVFVWQLFVRAFFSTNCLVKTVANRIEWLVETEDGYEYTLVRRDLSLPDAHSREEVLEMLTAVRQAERELGWTCPEPKELS